MSLIFAWGDLYFISSRAALSVRRDVDQEGNSRTAKTIKLMEVAISDGLHPIDFDEVSAFEVKIWSQAGGLDAVSPAAADRFQGFEEYFTIPHGQLSLHSDGLLICHIFATQEDFNFIVDHGSMVGIRLKVSLFLFEEIDGTDDLKSCLLASDGKPFPVTSWELSTLNSLDNLG